MTAFHSSDLQFAHFVKSYQIIAKKGDTAQYWFLSVGKDNSLDNFYVEWSKLGFGLRVILGSKLVGLLHFCSFSGLLSLLDWMYRIAACFNGILFLLIAFNLLGWSYLFGLRKLNLSRVLVIFWVLLINPNRNLCDLVLCCLWSNRFLNWLFLGLGSLNFSLSNFCILYSVKRWGTIWVGPKQELKLLTFA